MRLNQCIFQHQKKESLGEVAANSTDIFYLFNNLNSHNDSLFWERPISGWLWDVLRPYKCKIFGHKWCDDNVFICITYNQSFAYMELNWFCTSSISYISQKKPWGVNFMSQRMIASAPLLACSWRKIFYVLTFSYCQYQHISSQKNRFWQNVLPSKNAILS